MSQGKRKVVLEESGSKRGIAWELSFLNSLNGRDIYLALRRWLFGLIWPLIDELRYPDS